MDFKIINADCVTAMRELINAGVQVDSIVTDPPYQLGFMGKKWDSTGISNNVEMWRLCLELLKPGGHLLSFGGSRTYHRMACAVEDAGFEVRDCISWIYGSGFPKSLNVSKAIDKMAGAEREIVGKGQPMSSLGVMHDDKWQSDKLLNITAPSTDAAKQWDGWGSALKPAVEYIILARKPLSEKNIASNVLLHGTGGLNIDACRVEGRERTDYGLANSERTKKSTYGIPSPSADFNANQGRFPANLIHDGSDEVEAEFAKYGVRKSGALKKRSERFNTFENGFKEINVNFQASAGTASRFFYSAKASTKERQGSKHPTVKPIALMRYLCRLITPPNGTILDPFAGSGSTGEAALLEGFNCVLIEKELEYIADIEKRMQRNTATIGQQNAK